MPDLNDARDAAKWKRAMDERMAAAYAALNDRMNSEAKALTPYEAALKNIFGPSAIDRLVATTSAVAPAGLGETEPKALIARRMTPERVVPAFPWSAYRVLIGE